jgi:hypothetical protein
MSNQTVVATALRVLRRPGIWNIGFDLHGLCVTGQRYAMVAKAIEEGAIKCEVAGKLDPDKGQVLAAGMAIAARYVPDVHTMFFRSEDFGSVSGYQQTQILHEATHAIFDLYAKGKDTRTLAVEDEAAAVLAAALYVRLTDVVAISFGNFIDGSEDEALKLADKLMAETGDFERDRRTYFLRPDQTKKLRDAVAQEWNFVRRVDPDGSITDSTGVQYIYNGVLCQSCWAQGTPTRR